MTEGQPERTTKVLQLTEPLDRFHAMRKVAGEIGGITISKVANSGEVYMSHSDLRVPTGHVYVRIEHSETSLDPFWDKVDEISPYPVLLDKG